MLVVFGLLGKREKIPLGSVTLEGEKVLLFSSTLPGFWYSWSFSFLVDWTGAWALVLLVFADAPVC